MPAQRLTPAAPRAPSRGRPGRIGSIVAVTALLGFYILATGWSAIFLVPDAIHYLAIANSWVHGAGFVDPIKWAFYLPGPPPVPGFVVSPPVVSLLAAIPLALGGSLRSVGRWHQVIAVLVPVGAVLVGTRTMSPGAACAAGLLLGLSPIWSSVSRAPLTDIIAVGAILLVLAAARGVARSAAGGVLAAALTLLAWATRANLGALVAVVLVAVAWEMGPRQALRASGPRAYLITFVVGYALIHTAVVATTGFAPYAGFGFLTQVLNSFQAINFSHRYTGMWDFLSIYWRHAGSNVLGNVTALLRILFLSPRYLLVGWIIVPGVVYCLLRGGAGSIERRASALAVLAFTSVLFLTYAAFDVMRYPLPIVACGLLCALALLDDLLRFGPHVWRADRRDLPERDRWWGALPLAAIVLFLCLGGLRQTQEALAGWSAQLAGPPANDGSSLPGIPATIKMCRLMDPAALVATRNPWVVHKWCGNPTIMLPGDLHRPPVRKEFFRTERPRYVLVSDTAPQPWVQTARDLVRIGDAPHLELYERLGAGQDVPLWRPPPPLACAGLGPACTKKVGR